MASKKLKGYIFISNVTKALEHEWFVDAIDKKQFDLHFILFNAENSELHKYFTSKGFSCTNHRLKNNRFIPYFVILYWIKLLFARPDFVHSHLFQAGIIGTVSAKMAGIKKRIYTRHHADMHHVYHRHAIKYDVLVNSFSTHIFAVSKNGYKILTELEKADANKITIINHGIPEVLMDREVPTAEIEEIKHKYQLLGKYPVIGVVSRFVPEKGIQYIVPAFKKLLQQYPDAKLVLANAKGVYTPEVQALLKELPDDAHVQISFELKIDALFKNFSIFIHVPVNERSEAFGQVYLESMCLGIPMICTIAGVARSLVTDRHNAMVAEYESTDSIYQCITELLANEPLRNNIVINAHKDVKAFTFEKKFEKIMSIYLS